MRPKTLLDRHLGILFTTGAGGELTDGQLLERFSTRDGTTAEQAFEALIHRHGPMVLGVCQSSLADEHDAEDAFQATFLVLARQAKRLWVGDSLGPWLHQVAVRTAGSLRRANAKRKRYERLATPPTVQPPREPSDDIERLLHEELNRLPERFRVPVVLCDLEGQTHEQAARHLGWPMGTVKSRLTRARERLRGRLTRRGLSPESITATLAVGRTTGLALTDSLVSTTSAAALRFITTGTTLGGTAAILAQGVLSAMLMTRFWKAAAIFIVAATVSGAGLIGELRSSNARQVDPATPAPVMQKSYWKTSTPPQQVNPATPAPITQDFYRKTSTPPKPEVDATVAVEKAKRTITVSGRLEPVNATYVTSEISIPAKILSMLPEGEFVKEGTVVCELDSKELQSRLAAQKLVADAARFPLDDVRLDRNAAGAALTEYQEGALPAERKAILAEIKLAESTLQHSTARLEQLRSGLEKIGAIPQADANTAQSRSDALALLDLKDRADAIEQTIATDRAVLESKKNALETLEKVTAPRIIRKLQTELERKHLIIQRESKKADQEMERVRDLERQIKNCQIHAPRNGTIVYGGNVILPNLTIAEGQRLFGIAHVGTPWVLKAIFNPPTAVANSQIKIGQKAEVWINRPLDAEGPLNTEHHESEITEVNKSRNPYANGVTFWLEKLPGEFQPGDSGTAEFEIESETSTIIPQSAVGADPSGWHVAVKGSTGSFEKRSVSIEAGEGTIYRVTGLKAGEEIAVNPGSILLNLDGKEDHPQDAPEKKAEESSE